MHTIIGTGPPSNDSGQFRNHSSLNFNGPAKTHPHRRHYTYTTSLLLPPHSFGVTQVLVHGYCPAPLPPSLPSLCTRYINAWLYTRHHPLSGKESLVLFPHCTFMQVHTVRCSIWGQYMAQYRQVTLPNATCISLYVHQSTLYIFHTLYMYTHNFT